MSSSGVHACAPLRLGLAGGGTDVSPYKDVYGGRVLNITISLFAHCHITMRNDGVVRFFAADFDQSAEYSLTNRDPINSSKLPLHVAVYRRIVKEFCVGTPLPICVTTYADAPPGSGVGSSSALVVAMIKAYVELLNIPLGEYDIAQLAFEIERIDCAMAGGSQDQYAAAFGGLNFMEFEEGQRVIVNPLRLREEFTHDLQSRILLYYTGRSRDSASIILSQIDATKTATGSAIEAMHDLRQSAIRMKECLLRGSISDVVDILGASWIAKKKAAAAISNPHIELIANAALAAGARALKISGAGGGGFMMIAVDPPERIRVMRALDELGGRFYNFKFVEVGVRSWTLR
jgi:D-glycero-alpha-D-manno-heptose-7-phosphate kinase